MGSASALAELVALLRADGRLVDHAAQAQAQSDVQRWQRDGIRLLVAGQPDYPSSLTDLPNRPALLFTRGALRPEDASGVAVIGTRQPGPGGVRDAADCARGLVGVGRTVVSGLAQGIDTAAHSATLALGGRTVAVLGTGLDHAYPPENSERQSRIAASGALVSQFWPERGPTRSAFPARNALMAGLTCATVIVEAHATSGTRIQARHALAYGRGLILFERVMGQPWAQELARSPGVDIVADADEMLVALATSRCRGRGDGS